MRKHTKLIAIASTLSLLVAGSAMTGCDLFKTYTITWKNYDGTVLEVDEGVKRNATPTYDGLTPVKEKDAQYTYVWNGWTPSVNPAKADVEYIATYKEEVNNYNVLWKNYDDSLLSIQRDVPYGTTPTYEGADPVKPSTKEYEYVFEGWSPEVGAIEGNATYTAKFRQETRKYDITWKNEDGSIIKTEKVPYGTVPTYVGDAPTKENTTKYKYSFNGWVPSPTAVEGDAEYMATFNGELRTYTITWKNYDGTILEVDENVPYGSTPSYGGATPKKTARAMTYNWTGWDPMVLTVWGDQTYTAVFSEGKPFFSFDIIDYEMETGYSLSELQGSPWINSNIRGEIFKIKKPSLKDDFYTSVNYDKIRTGELGSFEVCDELVTEAFDAIYDNAQTSNSDFVRAVMNRLSGGDAEAISRYLNNIDLETYLSSKEVFYSKSGLFSLLPTSDGYELQFNDGYMSGNNGMQTLWFYSAYSGYEGCTNAANNILDKFDDLYGISFSTTDKGRIKTIEQNLCSSTWNSYNSGNYNSTTSTTVSGLQWDKLKTALKDLGLTDSTKIIYKKYNTNAINNVYNYASNTTNADGLKKAIIARLGFDNRFFVGASTYKSFTDTYVGTGLFSSENYIGYYSGEHLRREIIKAAFPILIEQAYIEFAGSQEVKDEITSLIDDILDAYKGMVNDYTWLSNDGKSKITSKLTNMRHESCYFDGYKNFPEIDDTDIENIQGLELAERYNKAYIDAVLDKTMTSSDLWGDQGMPSYTVNAFYSPTQNAFVILNACVKGLMGTCVEEEYGMIGAVIGHEITHAFDSSGSLFDQDGGYHQNGWLSSSDRRAFNSKVTKMVNFYNKIKLTKTLTADGDNVNGEATADMGGVQVMLKLAERIPDFDYDTFFRAFADVWCRAPISSNDVEERASDEHPFNYLRANVTLSQFDKFIETYDIQPGDGMYVPEEERIKIW